MPIAIGGEVKELRWKCQPDNEAIDFGRGIGAELAGFARNKSGQNQRKDWDNNTEYGQQGNLADLF